MFGSTLGQWNRAAVQVVPDGTHIINDGTMLTFKDPNGATSYVQLQKESALHKRDSGWIASVWSYANFTDYTATWAVPPIPTSPSGQIIFFFNSFENGAYNDILQPVLQYNNGVAGWTLASWYGAAGKYYESKPVPVSVGDAIHGVITLSGSIWSVLGYVNGVLQTTLTVSIASIGPQANAQFAMEVYGISSCSQYPPSDKLMVSDILLKAGTSIVVPAWSPSINPNSCKAAAMGTSTTATISWAS